jgi:hypothetical protein
MTLFDTANFSILATGAKDCICMSMNQSPKQVYQIREIGYQMAMSVAIEKHYLHRQAPCEKAFGLFCCKCSDLIGIVVYGTPSSAPLRSGICGKDESGNVIELTRLWIADGTPKNTESYLIGNTVSKAGKDIVVSFAEIEQGHIGVIYQATNWIYTGLSAKRTNWTIEGVESHCQTIADKYSADQIRRRYGEKFTLKDRPLKHRYVYFNGSKRRKSDLLKKLKYPILKYPKP